MQVVGVDRGRPAVAARLLCGEAHEVEVVLVEELGGSIDPCGPGQRRNGVDNRARLALGLAQRVFDSLTLRDLPPQFLVGCGQVTRSLRNPFV